MARNKDIAFWLEIGGGAGVLQDMAQTMVAKQAKAITDRANVTYSKQTGHQGDVFAHTQVIVGRAPSGGGTPRAWVAVQTDTPTYKPVVEALEKSISAGKVK